MPLSIRGKIYAAPNEGDQPGLLGKELVAIEEHFGLDGMILIAVLNEEKPSPYSGYTKAKAMFAFAWICLTRGGEILSIQDVLDEYSVDELIDLGFDDIKKEAEKLLEADSASE